MVAFAPLMPGPSMPEQLSATEAHAYWDERHRSEGDLRSGGDIGLDAEGNAIFYAVRLGKLLEIIGDQSSTTEPLFLLDAGCGKGYFADHLERCGHRVDGIDVSEAAIMFARAEHRGRYEVARLESYRSPFLYDVVYSVDVLFHILDDALWRDAVLNLASLVRLGGLFVMTDVLGDSRVRQGNYILHRTHADYVDLLGNVGLRFLAFHPYRFRTNPNGFAVFRRAA